MTEKAIAKWCKTAWPVSAKSEAECWRKAWADFGGRNCGLDDFMEDVKAHNLAPRKFGEVFILQLPGPSPELAEFLKREGL